LFDVEHAVMGQPAAQRRQARQRDAQPVIDALAAFLDASLAKILGRSELAKAIRYAARAGRRSRAISTTARWRSATTPPSAPSARSQ
jgi:hypothetical protein